MLNNLDDDGKGAVAASLRRLYALPATADNIDVVGGASEMTISPVADGVPLMGTAAVTSTYQHVSLSDISSKWGNPRIPARVYPDFSTFAADFHTYNAIVVTDSDFDLTFPLDLSEAENGSTIDLVAKTTSVRFSGSTKATVFLPPSARLRFSVKATAKPANTGFYLGYVRSTVTPTPSIFDVKINGTVAKVSFLQWVVGLWIVVVNLPEALVAGETEITVTSSIPFGTGVMRTTTTSEPTLTNGLDFPILTIYEVTQDGIVDGTLGFINPTQNNDAIWIEADAFQKNRVPIDISGLFANANVLEITDGLFDNQTIVGANRAFQSSRVNTVRAGAFAKAKLSGDWSHAFRQSQLGQIEEGAFPETSEITNLFGFCYNCASLMDIGVDVIRHAGKTCSDMTGVFYGCGQLTAIPTGLLKGCSGVANLSSAFGSSGLVSLPEGLLDDCVNLTNGHGIFGSSKLQSIPEYLFKHNTALTDLSNSFNGTAIAEIPERLFASLTKLTTLSYGFMYCNSLTTIPSKLLENCTALTDLSYCFYGTRNVSPFPIGILKGLVSLTNINSAFELCGSSYRYSNPVTFTSDFMADLGNLKTAVRAFLGCPFGTIEEGALDSLTKVTALDYFFGGPSWSPAGGQFTTVPGNLLSKCASVVSLSGFFASTGLTSIPANFFTNLPKKASVKSLASLFYGCVNLKELPAGLFDGYTGVTDISNIFYGLTQLTDIPDGLLLPMSSSVTTVEGAFSKTAITKLRNSYLGQFNALVTLTGLCSGCLSLTEVESGALGPSTKVTNISDMFLNCSSLAVVPDEPLVLGSVISYAQNTFAGCAALTTIYGSWFSVPTALYRVDSMFRRSGVTKVPAGLFSNKEQLGSLTYVFSEARNLSLVEAGWFTTPTKSGTVDFTCAFEMVADDIVFEQASIPLTKSSTITGMLGTYILSSGGGYVGIAGSINRLEGVFTIPSGEKPSQYSNLMATRNNTPNNKLTGTAKTLLTSIGLDQSDMSTVFRGNPNITWE